MEERDAIQAARAVLESALHLPVREGFSFDFGRQRDPRGISVLVPETRQWAHLPSMFNRLRPRLPAGLVAFLGTNEWLGDEPIEGQELVVAPGTSGVDAVRLARTTPIGVDLSHEGLVAALEEIDRSVGIDVWHADANTVELRLRARPGDVLALSRRLCALSPSLLEQARTPERFAQHLMIRGTAILFWPRPRTDEPLTVTAGGFEAMYHRIASHAGPLVVVDLPAFSDEALNRLRHALTMRDLDEALQLDGAPATVDAAIDRIVELLGRSSPACRMRPTHRLTLAERRHIANCMHSHPPTLFYVDGEAEALDDGALFDLYEEDIFEGIEGDDEEDA